MTTAILLGAVAGILCSWFILDEETSLGCRAVILGLAAIVSVSIGLFIGG